MTDLELQTQILMALARIETNQKGTAHTLARLESAVLGNPHEGAVGLMERVAVLEDREPAAGRKTAAAVVSSGAAGAVLITVLDWLWGKLSA